MASKLCPHSLRPTPDAKAWVEAGTPLVKLVNDFGPAPEYLRINPKLIIIGRGYTTLTLLQQYYSGDPPEVAARKFVDEQYARYYRVNPAVKIWEGHNEPSFGGPNDGGAIARMSWYGHFEAERLRLLNERGLRGVVGNFSTGYPEINRNELRMWEGFLPAVDAAKRFRGFLGLHEYAAPWLWWFTGDYQTGNCPGRGRPTFPGGSLGDMGWLTLRYRQVYRFVLQPRGLGNVPLVITECGNDRAGGGCPGMPAGAWKTLAGWWGGWDGSTDPIDYWRATPRDKRDTERYYAEQFMWYDRELQKDPYVAGATVFTFGADNAVWEPFNIAGSRFTGYVADHIRRTRSEAPAPWVDAPPEEVKPPAPPNPPSPDRGQPRLQYSRIYLLMPGLANDPAWVSAAASAVWPKHRLTIGGNADDGGIGNLHRRIVIAVNPETWGHSPPLHAWYAQNYPGTVVTSLRAASPQQLGDLLKNFTVPTPPAPPTERPNPPVGKPRAQYARTYILLNPTMTDPAWVEAAAYATWKKGRFTIGGNHDDAGIGDLNLRRIFALNPDDWGKDMEAWYAKKYPGVEFHAVLAKSPAQAEARLGRMV